MRPPGGCGVSFVMFHFAQRRRVEDVFVAAAHQDDRVRRAKRCRDRARYGSRCSFSCASCQSLLVTMTSPGRRCLTRAATAASTSAIVARARQIDAGAAAGVVQMVVGEAGNHRLAVQIDRRRRRAGELSDRGVRADGGEPPARDGDRLRDREPRVDGDDVAVDEDGVGRRGA